MANTSDKTVYMATGWCGFGLGSDAAAVDVKDGRIARVRPLHLTEKYPEEYLNRWKMTVRGHSLESDTKTLISPLAVGYKKRAYSKNRVPYPMKRVDWDPDGERNPQNRGVSGYERISWDEATSIIAAEIRRCIDTYGPSSIFLQGDGHGESKNIGGGHGCNTRLLDLLGGYTLQARQPDSWEGWYWGAKHMWGMDPVGQQTYQENLLRDISKNSDAVICVGCDPETTPWGWGGQMASKISFFWTELGIKQIYICPDLNYGAAVHADKWISPLPNTDAALWLGIAYTWIKEGTYDQEYLDTHTVGFDEFKAYVMGEEDGKPKTPEWAESKCAVPARDIVSLARYWATHNVTTVHCNGGGYIRSAFSTEPARLEIALLAMQGLGAPGKNMFKMMEWCLFGMQNLNPMPHCEWPTFVGKCYTGHMPGNGMDCFIPQTLVPDAILLPEGEKLSWYGHVICSLPKEDQYNKFEYPAEGASRIHMFWTDTPCWSTCWNGGNRMQDALRDPSIEFMLVQHPWLENDTYFADIIIPTTTKFEEDDLGVAFMSGDNDMILHEAQAIDPIGEAKSDSEAVYAIAEKLGVADVLMESWCYPDNVVHMFGQEAVVLEGEDAVMLHDLGEPSWETLRKVGYYGGGNQFRMDYEEFLDKGYLPAPFKKDWEDGPIGMREFYYDPQNHPIDTPSGKIEFHSSALEEHWGDDPERPIVPKWIEESDSHHERLTNERGREYPFLLVSNHPRFRVHAQHDDIPWLREIEMCKVTGPDGYKYEPVWINPLDAAKKGIENGDIVRLFNERGSVLGGAIVTPRIRTNTLSQDHGAHVDTIVAGTGGLDRGGANNLICPGNTTSKNAPGEVTNGYLVDIEKVDVLELARKYPEQFNRDYDPACGMTASARIVKEA